MVKEFFIAIASYQKAFRYMMKRSLWKWQIVPGVISIILGSLVFGLAYRFGNNLGEYMMFFYPFDFGAAFLASMFNVFGKIMLFVTGLFMYRWILLIMISPFLSVISEQVEKLYTGSEGAKFSLSRMFKDIGRGILMTLKIMKKELFYTMLNLILGVIPIVGFLSFPLSFAIQGYFSGFGNMDFAMERHFNVKERIRFVNQHKGLAIGNGLIFLLILSIPLVGLFFAPTLAVIAATLNVLDYGENGHLDLVDLDLVEMVNVKSIQQNKLKNI